MMRRPVCAPLNVFLNNRHVGRLTRQASGAIEFAYVDDWLALRNAIPVSLSLALRPGGYHGDRVLAVFENLLPKSRPIRTRVAERVGPQGADAFSLLSEIDCNCVGALQFVPDDIEPPDAMDVTGVRSTTRRLPRSSPIWHTHRSASTAMPRSASQWRERRKRPRSSIMTGAG
jgi:serine/threonine-protein kinase HipA